MGSARQKEANQWQCIAYTSSQFQPTCKCIFRLVFGWIDIVREQKSGKEEYLAAGSAAGSKDQKCWRSAPYGNSVFLHQVWRGGPLRAKYQSTWKGRTSQHLASHIMNMIARAHHLINSVVYSAITAYYAIQHTHTAPLTAAASKVQQRNREIRLYGMCYITTYQF